MYEYSVMWTVYDKVVLQMPVSEYRKFFKKNPNNDFTDLDFHELDISEVTDDMLRKSKKY